MEELSTELLVIRVHQAWVPKGVWAMWAPADFRIAVTRNDASFSVGVASATSCASSRASFRDSCASPPYAAGCIAGSTARLGATNAVSTASFPKAGSSASASGSAEF